MRGRQYWQQRRVSHFMMRDSHDPMIQAEVEGSDTVPYSLGINVVRDEDRVDFRNTCSCPVGGDCKHVVAALLEACNRMQLEQVALRKAGPKLAPVLADSALPYEVRSWLERMTPGAAEPASSSTERKRLLYILMPRRAHDVIILKLYTVRLLKDGAISDRSLEPYHSAETALRSPPKFIGEDDLDLLRALFPYRLGNTGEYMPQGRQAASLLRELLISGRCYWMAPSPKPLKLGEPRPAHAEWTVADDGAQRLSLRATPEATGLLSFTPPWYVDAQTGECGELQTGLEPHLARALADSPLLPAQYVSEVAEQLARRMPATLLPAPKLRSLRQIKGESPRPVLFLYGSEERLYSRGPQQCAARVYFEYRDVRIKAGDTDAFISVRDGDQVLQIERNRSAEQRYIKQLVASGGLQPAGRVLQRWELNGIGADDYTVDAHDVEQAWNHFILDALPQLVTQGWKAEYDLNFPYRYAEAEEWFGGVVEEAGNDWFGLELGIQVDGERINLLPLLVSALRMQPDLSASKLAQMPEDSKLTAELPDGRRIVLPLARVRPILQTLVELYDSQPLDDEGRLRLSRLDALRLAELQAADAAAQLRWLGGEHLLALGHKLKDFSRIMPVTQPEGLKADLRPYQREGLSWLQFLREYGFGGILADDMGLGKTVQTLAHILFEKEAGRLDRPALVIAPTSLVGNWQREAKQFTPQLRVLALHGLQRKQHFRTMTEYDLIVTTYPLLSRDKDALLAQEFHLLVLDEAQNIKNAKTQAAQMVQLLKSRHRLCLTGTPMENHLGELWSQFHFLQPGLLGDDKKFKRLYRTPIEKQGDAERRTHLIRRIAPFILRRTKGQVAKDLPPKTEIVRSVALSGAQRDLYETVRLAMNDKVREAVAGKGLSRSHIVILDALLKLRQVCCDPRLLKLEGAHNAADESAKLALLMDLVPEMLEEGRRILLFSQFTSMLELIETELNERGIKYLKLTGETQNRTDIVERFQRGDVPLFLISLKAGGVGLNLTAADTVIHYDPWWNPAVENQATDRAHRIGQDKPVFVYKLIVEGSVEEKIMAMQQRKAELAAGILDGAEATVASTLESSDLQALFEPMA